MNTGNNAPYPFWLWLLLVLGCIWIIYKSHTRDLSNYPFPDPPPKCMVIYVKQAE